MAHPVSNFYSLLLESSLKASIISVIITIEQSYATSLINNYI